MVKQKDVIDIQRKKTKTKKLVFIRSEEKKREIRSDFEEEAVKRSETYRQIGFSRCECVCLSRLVVVVVVVATLSVCLWNLWCGGSVVQLFLYAQHNLNRPTSSIQAIELSMKGGRKEGNLSLHHPHASIVGLWWSLVVVVVQPSPTESSNNAAAFDNSWHQRNFPRHHHRRRRLFLLEKSVSIFVAVAAVVRNEGAVISDDDADRRQGGESVNSHHQQQTSDAK